MDVRYRLRRTRLLVLGEEWWLPLVGAVTTAAIFVGLALWSGLGLRTIALVASSLGGFVTGAAHGRNWLGAALVAFRAIAVAFAVVAVVTAVGLFVAWRTATGENYFYMAPFVGSLAFLLLPVFGMVGAAAGAIGNAVRRQVVPNEYNPPAY